MPRLPRRMPVPAGVVFAALAAITSSAATPAEVNGINSGPVLPIAGLGKGTAPLGVVANPTYKEETITLREGDPCSLYTDGLLEDRNPSGEIFSFARLDALFCSRPNAAEATEAAVNFGQDDDITVLTLTRQARN